MAPASALSQLPREPHGRAAACVQETRGAPAAIPNCRPRRMAHCCCLKPLRSGCLVPQQINGMLPLQTASYFSDSARSSPAPAQQLQPPLLPGLHRASLSLRAETRCPHTAVSDIGQVEFRLPVNQHRSHIRGQRLCPHLLHPQLKNSMPGVSPHSPPLWLHLSCPRNVLHQLPIQQIHPPRPG